MKLPEDEQKTYEHYKDDLDYQASMFESSLGMVTKKGRLSGRKEENSGEKPMQIKEWC